MKSSRKIAILSFVLSAINVYGDIIIDGIEESKKDVVLKKNANYIKITNTSNTLINEAVIKNEGLENKGTGVIITQGLGSGNVENIGAILGNSLNLDNGGNGIGVIFDSELASVSSNIRVNKIINRGIIKGKSSSANYSGNGIGVISGTDSVINKNHKAIIKNILNNGVVEGKTETENKGLRISGNGIGTYTRNSEIDLIENNGIIEGKSKIESTESYGTGNGILGYSSFGDLEVVSKIGNIKNSGNVKGSSYGAYKNSHGNGISNYFHGSTTSNARDIKIENVENVGMISGDVETNSGKSTSGSGNGISSYNESGKATESRKSQVIEISNKGIVSGRIDDKSTGKLSYSNGNGIAIYSKNKDSSYLESLFNEGVIRGYAKTSKNNYNYSGNGVSINGNLGKVKNFGIISGSENAIKTDTISELASNYGILVGKEIISSEVQEKYENYGLEIKIDSLGNILTVNKSNKKSSIGKEIMNLDIFENKGSLSLIGEVEYADTVINGIGVDDGTLKLEGNSKVTLNNSIINAYDKVISFEKEASLIANNTIFNGSGVEGDKVVILGSIDNNNLNLDGESIVNGNIDLVNGSNIVSIGNEVIINGNIDAGVGINNILNLGKSGNEKALNIFNELNNFGKISTNGNINLFEVASINSGDINIETGILNVRVNSEERTEDGKIKGHALYEHTGNLTAENGKLIFDLNGTGTNNTIAMNGTEISKEIDSLIKKEDKLLTNSLILDAELNNNGDVDIIVKKDLNSIIDGVSYEKLNDIYSSIYTAEKLGLLKNTTKISLNEETFRMKKETSDKSIDEAISALLDALGQIYLNNPYAYSLKLSRDTLKTFENNASYAKINARENELIAQGDFLYTHTSLNSEVLGNGSYGFDKNSRKDKTTSKITGGLATIEYGLKNTSLGLILGGANGKVKLESNNTLKEESLYFGIYGKKQIKNFGILGGIGYQYSDLKGVRTLNNEFDAFKTQGDFKTNSINTFLETKYKTKSLDNWHLEPKLKFSYYLINQDSVDEGYKGDTISLKTDKIKASTADVELGLDFIKNMKLSNSNFKLVSSISLINTIGDNEKDLNGYILGANKNGEKFDIKGAKIPERLGKIGTRVEYEKKNFIYSVGLIAEFGDENYRNIYTNLGVSYSWR